MPHRATTSRKSPSCRASPNHETAMISRQWKGVADAGHSEAYVRHLEDHTFPALAKIPGFVQASILRRAVAGGTEFQIATVWDSLEAIVGFAGEQIDVAVVPPAAQALLSSYDRHVVHYEIADTFPPGSARTIDPR
jgi:heme-degrading monooxygenase HmoA